MTDSNYIPVMDQAMEEPFGDWDKYLERVAEIAETMPPQVKELAGIFWSIERFGDLNHTGDPAPLHLDLAVRLLADPEAVYRVQNILKDHEY